MILEQCAASDVVGVEIEDAMWRRGDNDPIERDVFGEFGQGSGGEPICSRDHKGRNRRSEQEAQ
jgi:hypothetical protein